MVYPILLAELIASDIAIKSEVKIYADHPINESKALTQNQAISITPKTAITPELDFQQPEFASGTARLQIGPLEQTPSASLSIGSSEHIPTDSRVNPASIPHPEATGYTAERVGAQIAQLQQPDPNRDRLIQPDTEPPAPLPS